MLRLTEHEAGLWDLYQQDRSSALAVPRAPLVVERWERSRALGVRADGPAHPLGILDQDLAVRRDAALVDVGEGLASIVALEEDITKRGLLALLTDGEGVIIRARGGEEFSEAVRKTRLVEGARWDEGARGTNAIGTSIVEAQPVAVVGRAHFESVNHGLFCYAAPIHDPFGAIVAVLDVSGPVERDDPTIGSQVRATAARIEDVLRGRAYASAETHSFEFVERMLERSNVPALLVEAPGIVRRVNASASHRLAMPEAASVEHVFGLGWSELVAASTAGHAIFETRRHRYRIEFESVMARNGRTLALLCFLSEEPPHWRARRLRSAHVPPAFDPVLGTDARLTEAKRVASRVASSDLPVLLLAETGTGKELFARAIHDASPRAVGPFVPINCGALTPSLVESELFGYAPGSFTGAGRGGSAGRLAAAEGGTLFLDEVAEMPASAQAMLLRFLDDGTYLRVGESVSRRADVRVVCATSRDLPALVEDGVFRSDLFFRVQGGCLRLPPLRERSDRVELARALLRAAAEAQGITRPIGLDATAEAWVMEHDWPGNVRELKSALAYALVMAPKGDISREDFPEPLVRALPADAGTASATRRGALHRLAEDAVGKARGNISEAARNLGVARSTIYRMLGRTRR